MLILVFSLKSYFISRSIYGTLILNSIYFGIVKSLYLFDLASFYCKKMGIGLKTFYVINNRFEMYADYLYPELLGFMFILYLLDCHHWSSRFGIFLRRLCIVLLTIGFNALILCTSAKRPYAPISVMLVMTPVFLSFVRLLFYPEVYARDYISWLTGPLYLVSVLTFISWFIWTLVKDENAWNVIRGIAEAEQAGCKPDFDEYPDCQNADGSDNVCFEVDLQDYSITFDYYCDEMCTQVYDSCLNTFMIWVGPFLVSVGFLCLSFFSSFIRRAQSQETDSLKFLKVWMFLVFVMWVTASLAGAGSGVTTALTAFTLAAFIASAVFLAVSFNHVERDEQIAGIKVKIVEKYGNHLDLFRGLLIVTCTPIVVVWIFLSMFIQGTRNLATKCFGLARPASDTASLRNVYGAGYITSEARRLVREFQSWKTAKVCTYAVYWGILFMTMNVIVAQFTLVFLSWLIEVTSSMALFPVTGILVGVGMIMFLLPPVPGVPIYLTLGIVIVPVGQEKMGLTFSILYAIAVSVCLKLLACTLQQKGIGGLLKNNVGIRQMVGVNSTIIRSMKLVLKEKGLGVAKVSILVGGPDWPTSVLCGIMDLPLLPILFGTLPIVFLITPTLLTGSFTYLSSMRTEDGQAMYPWAGTATAVSAAITGLVQFGSMIVAAFFLEQTVADRQDELDAIPIDKEVKEADERDEEFNEAYEEITKWEEMPFLAKLCLLLSLGFMIICCYVVQLFADSCFVEYELTYTIDTHLGGDWKNIVLPLGFYSIVIFIVSILFLIFFRSWASVSYEFCYSINPLSIYSRQIFP